MSFDITPEDLEVLGTRFKAAIRQAKTNAGKLEKKLGISKGSLTRLYKGKYPLREDLLRGFAEEVGADPAELVADTIFAVMHGFQEQRTQQEPDPTPKAQAAPAPKPSPASSPAARPAPGPRPRPAPRAAAPAAARRPNPTKAKPAPRTAPTVSPPPSPDPSAWSQEPEEAAQGRRRPTLVPSEFPSLYPDLDDEIPPPIPEAERSRTPDYPVYPAAGLDSGRPLHMDVPLEEQQTLSDADDEVPVDLKATEAGSDDRAAAPAPGVLLDDDDDVEELLLDDYLDDDDDLELEPLLDDHDAEEDVETVNAPPQELIESVRAKQSTPPGPHLATEDKKPPSGDPDEEKSLISSITSRFKGLFG